MVEVEKGGDFPPDIDFPDGGREIRDFSDGVVLVSFHPSRRSSGRLGRGWELKWGVLMSTGEVERGIAYCHSYGVLLMDI